MSDPNTRKDHPLSMRLAEADIAIIDRAASLRGRSRTDFVREAAVRAAEEALLGQTLIRMTGEGFEDFLAMLARQPAPVPEMQTLLGRPSPWDPTPHDPA